MLVASLVNTPEQFCGRMYAIMGGGMLAIWITAGGDAQMLETACCGVAMLVASLMFLWSYQTQYRNMKPVFFNHLKLLMAAVGLAELRLCCVNTNTMWQNDTHLGAAASSSIRLGQTRWEQLDFHWIFFAWLALWVVLAVGFLRRGMLRKNS